MVRTKNAKASMKPSEDYVGDIDAAMELCNQLCDTLEEELVETSNLKHLRTSEPGSLTPNTMGEVATGLKLDVRMVPTASDNVRTLSQSSEIVLPSR
ncbi:hypothetical protein R1flu_020712 [Riccia fluitans]|uniref:Uncharacterized protein n=1 Tax=Riccia fluitans TaxID=41844 RepID=A0ABD1ZQR5_9MARC